MGLLDQILSAVGVNTDSSTSAPQAATAAVTIDGHSYQLLGAIDHHSWQAGQRAGFQADAVPATLDAFKQLRDAVAGEPHGAVALQILAFELFRRDQQAGAEALTLNNTGVNARACVERLRELTVRQDPYYSRPYLAASFFEGATPDNGYTPRRPLRLSIRSSVNKGYQASQLLGGTVLYLDVYSEGYDTPWRSIEVVRPEGTPYYVVSNCPACYTQCKAIAPGATFHGL